jgi:hypothetical protein
MRLDAEHREAIRPNQLIVEAARIEERFVPVRRPD